VDTVEQLETTVDLFLHGGFDPFNNQQVTAYVQKYAPGYDLPHVFVSQESDGFNRNVILSRHPFADLNGDTKATQSDIPFVFPDEYAAGGDGGIRGFMFAEIDLPDADYAGDLAIGNAHLKAGFGGDNHDQRVTAASNVAYYVDYLLNGAGTGIPDPHAKILDSPSAQTILGDETPVILVGDWNEDEETNGTKGPAEWLRAAEFVGSDDGTDRDRSDSTLDGAAEPFTGDTDTQGSSKLDYVAVQDSIAEIRHALVFNSGDTPIDVMPPEILAFPTFAGLVSGFASDHLPVVVDAVLPLAGDDTAPGPFALVAPADGEQGVATAPTLEWEPAEGALNYEIVVALDADLIDVVWGASDTVETSITVPDGVLDTCATYHWGVAAGNEAGETPSTPASASFGTVVAADVNQDGSLDILDFVAFQNLFVSGDANADFNGDGELNILDFVAFQEVFTAGGC
jgi:endonuclease/exonuclease/phosphatase family metal-dependent hydrolase